MKKQSLKNRIQAYLEKHGGWVNGGQLERLAMNAGYKASNASRRAREMVTGKLSDGRECPIVLERKEMNGSVWYRALNPKKKVIYSVPQSGIKFIAYE